MNVTWIISLPIWLLAVVFFLAGVVALSRPVNPPKTDHDATAFVILMFGASACAYFAAIICGWY